MASTTLKLDEILKTPLLESIDPDTLNSIISAPPFVKIPGVFNFRDIGGLPVTPTPDINANPNEPSESNAPIPKLKVRPGILFRSAHLTHITPAGCNALKDLGVGAVFDFRTEGEIKRDSPSSQPVSSAIPNATPQTVTYESDVDATAPPAQPTPARNASSVKFTENGLPDLSEQGIRIHHIPLEDLKVLTKQDTVKMIAIYSKGEDGFLEGYEKNILSIAGKSYGIVLRYILEQSRKDSSLSRDGEGEGEGVKGCVWNCHNRTGVFAALLLQLLGVPDEEIARDYALSRAGLESLRPLMLSQFGDMIKINPNSIAVFGSNASLMIKFLKLVNTKYGGARKYFVDYAGVTNEELDAIKDWLVVENMENINNENNE